MTNGTPHFSVWFECMPGKIEINANGTRLWLDTQNQASACRSRHTWLYVFSCEQTNSNTLNPIDRKSSATCTREIIHVDINPKNAVHFKLVLINKKYKNHSCWRWWVLYNAGRNFAIKGDFNLPNIDWTLQRPTPAPGNKLMQLLADNNLKQHVHETNSQNSILDLVISTEEWFIVNLKIIDKTGDHQAIQYSIKTNKENIT